MSHRCPVASVNNYCWRLSSSRLFREGVGLSGFVKMCRPGFELSRTLWIAMQQSRNSRATVAQQSRNSRLFVHLNHFYIRYAYLYLNLTYLLNIETSSSDSWPIRTWRQTQPLDYNWLLTVKQVLSVGHLCWNNFAKHVARLEIEWPGRDRGQQLCNKGSSKCNRYPLDKRQTQGNVELTSGQHGANLRATWSQPPDNVEPTSGQRGANPRATWNQPPGNVKLIFRQRGANLWATWSQPPGNLKPTSGKRGANLQATCMEPTSGQRGANLWATWSQPLGNVEPTSGQPGANLRAKFSGQPGANLRATWS